MSSNAIVNEIDLMKLSKQVYAERLYVGYTIALFILVAAAYLFLKKPTYLVSVELFPPRSGDLENIKPLLPKPKLEVSLNEHYGPLEQLISLATSNSANALQEAKLLDEDYTSKQHVFSLFLSLLNSNTHISSILQEEELISRSFTIAPDDDGAIMKMKHSRRISFQESDDQLQPNIYSLKMEGYDREALKRLIIMDLQKATQTINEEIKKHYLNLLANQLKSIEVDQQVKLNSLKAKVKIRKQFIQETQKAEIAKLEEQSQIAGLTNNKALQRKLQAEIEVLKQRTPNEIYDKELISMQAQKGLFDEYNLIEQLKTEIERVENYSEKINFSNNIVVAPEAPISPNKPLILLLAAIAGTLLGILIAIVRSTSSSIE